MGVVVFGAFNSSIIKFVVGNDSLLLDIVFFFLEPGVLFGLGDFAAISSDIKFVVGNDSALTFFFLEPGVLFGLQ